MTFNYSRPYLYPKQLAAFFCKERFSVILGATKSGKTVAAIAWLFEQAITTAHLTGAFWWISPSYNQSKVAYTRLKKWLKGMPGELYSTNDSEMTVRLFNGNVIAFKSADRIDNLYGEDCWAVVLDEASRCKEEIWLLVTSVLTATEGPARLVGNVRGRNWFWQLYQKHLYSESDRFTCHSLTCWDAVEAGIVSRAIIEEARAEHSEAAFQQLYENIPADQGQNPFGYQAILDCCSEGTTVIASGVDLVDRRNARGLSDLPPVVWGVDLGKAVDYSVVIGLDQNGAVCRFERFRDSWEATVARILGLVGENSEDQVLVDSSGVGDPIFEQLDRAVPGKFRSFKFTTVSRQQVLEGLALGIQQRRVRFPDGQIRVELESFEIEYQAETGRVRYTAPDSSHDDCVMSLALAWSLFTKGANTYALSLLNRF